MVCGWNAETVPSASQERRDDRTRLRPSGERVIASPRGPGIPTRLGLEKLEPDAKIYNGKWSSLSDFAEGLDDAAERQQRMPAVECEVRFGPTQVLPVATEPTRLVEAEANRVEHLRCTTSRPRDLRSEVGGERFQPCPSARRPAASYTGSRGEV